MPRESVFATRSDGYPKENETFFEKARAVMDARHEKTTKAEESLRKMAERLRRNAEEQ